MSWQRLDRENTLKVIESVRSAGDPGLFSPGTCEVQKSYLSFYSGIELYKLTNFASLPSFTFQYLGDGRFFQYLDGTEQPIYIINDKGTLSLNDRSVVDYVEFFLSHVTVNDDEMFLIQSPRDMPLLDSLDADSIKAISSNHTAPKVTYDAGFDKYTVEADLYAEGLLMRAEIEVAGNGRVSIQNQRMIVNAIAHSARSGIMA